MILIKTVKGDGMVGMQGSNSVHQKKNLDSEQRLSIAKNLGIPLDETSIKKANSIILDLIVLKQDI